MHVLRIKFNSLFFVPRLQGPFVRKTLEICTLQPLFVDIVKPVIHDAITMSTRPGDSRSPRATRRPPKGPLIIILLVLASMVWVYWLTRSTPRPPPELPPLRQLPLDPPTEQGQPPDHVREQR